MVNEKDTGALINQIREVTRDHIDWIKEQLLKPNNFMVAKGREVWIDVPNSKLKNIVPIPNKNEPNYRLAWIRVYNLAVDYLEDSLSYACMSGKIDYRTINWPDFNPENADYARKLESVLTDFKLKEAQRIKEEEEKSKLSVIKSSVVLSPVNIPNKDEPLTFKHASKEEDVDNFESPAIEETETEEVLSEEQPSISEFTFRKILDGDKITKKDFRDLYGEESNLVLIPCQDVDNLKEEKLFFENMGVCAFENIKTGVMIYGKAIDEKDAAYELKKILKLLEQCGNNFAKCVIYEINDKFVSKNKDSEMKLLSLINAYMIIAEGLAREGLIPIISMSLNSKKILDDISSRYNLDSKYEIIYRVLVRELDDLEKNDSIILMDPQYDYDIVTLKNPKFNNGEMIKSVLKTAEVKNTTLARAA